MATEKVTDSTFDEKVISEKNKTVLVDFWAEWCGPCRMLAPIVEAVSDKFSDKLAVYKLDTDQNPETAQAAQITSIPCCIVYKNGEEIHRIIGHKPQASFESELAPHL